MGIGSHDLEAYRAASGMQAAWAVISGGAGVRDDANVSAARLRPIQEQGLACEL